MLTSLQHQTVNLLPTRSVFAFRVILRRVTTLLIRMNWSTLYRSAGKSLARPWKETSYSDQDSQHYTKTYGVQTTPIYSCCLYAISLGRCSLFPSRVGLRTYQHPGIAGRQVRWQGRARFVNTRTRDFKLWKPAFWMGKNMCTDQTCWNLLRTIELSSGGLFYPEERGSKFVRSTCKYIHTRRRYIRRSGKSTVCGRNSEDYVNCGLCCVSGVWLCCSGDRFRLRPVQLTQILHGKSSYQFLLFL